MTRKQMNKFAQEIYQCELTHQNENSSKEEKVQAENRIMQLTNQIMCLPDGINVLMEIDAIVASKMKN